MELADLNYLAVLVGGIIIFILGGLWYSLIFAKTWMKLHGKVAEDVEKSGQKAGAGPYVLVFFCGLISSLVIALLFHLFGVDDVPRGVHIAALFWLGFTGPAMLANTIFSFRPWKLWLIDASYYLVAYMAVGALHAAWH
ncbi:MAG TPA: DUF1761 domain-containing protein [Thermoanaerobaculia bacterium]|nr:DUF1761 domain-containing protein [Thermoanaerobaculia bacterium]